LYGRVARGGGSLDPEPRLLSEAFSIGRTLASPIGSDVLVVWQESPSDDYATYRLRAAIVHTADGSAEEVALPSGVEPTAAIAVANDGASWLVAAGTKYLRIS